MGGRFVLELSECFRDKFFLGFRFLVIIMLLVRRVERRFVCDLVRFVREFGDERRDVNKILKL